MPTVYREPGFLPGDELLRLSSDLQRAVESALDDNRADDAIRQLRAAVESDARTVDVARLLALAARQSGFDGDAVLFLNSAFRLALSDGDLIGAVDALRRLETMGVDTEARWTELFAELAERGFTNMPHEVRTVEVDVDERHPVDADDDLVTTRSIIAGWTAAPPDSRPFSGCPILQDLPTHERCAALRALQLRVVRAGQSLGLVGRGGPVWIVSGAIVHLGREYRLPPGAAVLADAECIAAPGATRVLALAPDLWAELSDDAHVQAALQDYERRARLCRALDRSSCFRKMTPDTRRAFLASIAGVSAHDEHLIHRGQRVRGLFLLVAGDVAVIDDSSSTANVIAALEIGDVFGEIDLLTERGASYSVVARGPVELCYIDTAQAQHLLRSEPSMRASLVELAEQRQRDVPVLSTGEFEALELEDDADHGDDRAALDDHLN